MDLPKGIDDYIRETIDDSLGLPVSLPTLQSKLLATQESERRLRNQHVFLLSKLKEKNELIDRAKSEASINAQALKKFVEENQKLASECANLLSQCHKWEKECSLYDQDREALMEFGNEADERAKDAELRVCQLEEELAKALQELHYYKHEHDTQQSVDSPTESTSIEDSLLDSLLTAISNKDLASGYGFLEANTKNESCKELLEMWNCLKPSTQRVVSLIAEVKSLEKDKEHLRINLHRAEEEVKLLFEENNILDEENKRLLLRQHKERKISGSAGKHTSSASVKSNKRKSSPKTSSPIERRIDFDEVDSARQPLSPLRNNSPDSRMHKK